jgi:hypothetical protein
MLNPAQMKDPLGGGIIAGGGTMGVIKLGETIANWWNERESEDPCGDANNNPYDGPVEDPIIVVDPQGNAIPVGQGEQIQTSPDGQWVDVKNDVGQSTGTQIHGPHKPTTHGDQPDALKPHAHRPGNPGNNHWLPVH